MDVFKVDLLKLFVVTDSPFVNVLESRRKHDLFKALAAVESSVLDLFDTFGDNYLLYIFVIGEGYTVDSCDTLLCRDLDDAVLVTATDIGL